MEDIKNKSNSDLVKIQKELSEEFNKVREDMVKLYDYWNLIEKKYMEVHNELNNRFGVNNK